LSIEKQSPFSYQKLCFVRPTFDQSLEQLFVSQEDEYTKEVGFYQSLE